MPGAVQEIEQTRVPNGHAFWLARAARREHGVRCVGDGGSVELAEHSCLQTARMLYIHIVAQDNGTGAKAQLAWVRPLRSQEFTGRID